ncbi:hypothetical protein ACNKHT_01050 [Shigella flexneri]
MGAGLGLVGGMLRKCCVTRWRRPTTLGVATGAQLGITVTTLWAIPVLWRASLPRWWALCRSLNRLWRRVGNGAFTGYAPSRGAGGEPLLRRN